jgi:uncharacterized protein
MKLEQSFEVAAPLERVWKALIDVEHVAPCLPGASVTGRNDDGSYSGSLTLKIGPTTAAYAGKLEMEQIDESSHSAVMQAHGTDKRGQGGATATISSTLHPIDDGNTKVDVVTDYHITGRLARFGRGGMIEDISERLLREFAQRLQDSLTDEPAAGGQDGAPDAAQDGAQDGAQDAADGDAAAAGDGAGGSTEAKAPPTQPRSEPVEPKPVEPLDAVPLVASVVRKRAAENPAPLAALVIGFLLAIVIFRRRGRG